MKQRTVNFRGRRVAAGWPEMLREAQLLTTCVLDGIELPRVRYGDEKKDWGADEQACHDCAAIKGEFHVPGCDVERCPACDGQLLSCDCRSTDDLGDDASEDAGH